MRPWQGFYLWSLKSFPGSVIHELICSLNVLPLSPLLSGTDANQEKSDGWFQVFSPGRNMLASLNTHPDYHLLIPAQQSGEGHTGLLDLSLQKGTNITLPWEWGYQLVQYSKTSQHNFVYCYINKIYEIQQRFRQSKCEILVHKNNCLFFFFL